MSQESKTQKPQAGPVAPAMTDLSDAINQSVERQSDEEVRSVRVFDDRYRCNWWVREKSSNWMSFNTGVIRRSKFLRVSKIADKLVIEDLSNQG